MKLSRRYIAQITLSLGGFVAAMVIALYQVACAAPPPNLTPAAVVAFRQTEIVKDLDRVRDVANDAHHTAPPLLTAEVTKEIVTWHQTAIRLVHDRSANWQSAVLQGLNELQRHLSEHDRQLLAPYLVAVRTLLAEVHP